MSTFPGKKRYFPTSKPTKWHLYEQADVFDNIERLKIKVLTEINADKKRLLTRGIKASDETLSGPNKKTFPSELPQAPPAAHARFKGAFRSTKKKKGINFFFCNPYLF